MTITFACAKVLDSTIRAKAGKFADPGEIARILGLTSTSRGEEGHDPTPLLVASAGRSTATFVAAVLKMIEDRTGLARHTAIRARYAYRP